MHFSLANQFLTEFRAFSRGYPKFVFSGSSAALEGHIPVFVYHTVEPKAFEKDLRFLADNGYQPIGMEEFVAYLRGRSSRKNAVVLTFDDARSSFWRFAFPLLQQYEMKAVLFAIVGLSTEAPSTRKNLESVWNGGCGLDDVVAEDPKDATLCTWPELKVMYESGCVDIESHSLFHREVFVGSELMGFFGPDSNYVPYQTSATAYLSLADVGRAIVPSDYYGLPLLRAASLYEGLPAIEIPESLKDWSRSLWLDWQDAEQSDAWHDALKTEWTKVDLGSLPRQSEAAVDECLKDDISTARDLIKERIDSAAGNHFCLPFTSGSERTVRNLQQLGIESCAWGVLPGKKHNARHDDPWRICRLKSDFLWRMPGVGQRRLISIYGKKLHRRLRREPVY